jgi:IS1 family transposase
MANNAISALTVGAEVVTLRNPMATRLKSVNASGVPIRSAAVCAVCPAPSALRAILSVVGSKKEATLPEVHETLVEPDPAEPATSTLEVDELWSFILKKTNNRWVWIALSRASGQVVAYLIGDRSRATCQKLWEQIPASYRRAHCYTDFWEAYQGVIPSKQQTAVGKETGLRL